MIITKISNPSACLVKVRVFFPHPLFILIEKKKEEGR